MSAGRPSDGVPAGTMLYLVRWRGFGPAENSWERASDLPRGMTAEFERRLGPAKTALAVKKKMGKGERPVCP